MQLPEVFERKTKIICTIGPNQNSVEDMKDLIMGGMNLARFNFSHGSHEEHTEKIAMLKQAREELGAHVAFILDTKGPEIRTGLMEDGQEFEIEEGEECTFAYGDFKGTRGNVPVNYPDFCKDLRVGNRILIDDGKVIMQVIEDKDDHTRAKCIQGGPIGEQKGINLPDTIVSMPAVTASDIDDIKFGIEQGCFDFIAASFIQSAEGVRDIKRVLEDNNCDYISIMSKIECASALNNIEEIIDESDAILIARGDLGVEISLSKLPYIQDRLIRLCSKKFKPVAVATQMLETMIQNPIPTRAEVTDVSLAVFQGADAIMLSGETAVGKYPLQALKQMDIIAKTYERYVKKGEYVNKSTLDPIRRVSCAIGDAAVMASVTLDAAAIVTPTMTGSTARLISKYKPEAPIFAFSSDEHARNRMLLLWGVYPIEGFIRKYEYNVIELSLEIIKEKKLVEDGSFLVFTAGDPKNPVVVGEEHVTNSLQIMQMDYAK